MLGFYAGTKTVKVWKRLENGKGAFPDLKSLQFTRPAREMFFLIFFIPFAK